MLEVDFQEEKLGEECWEQNDGSKGNLKIKIYTHITGCGFEVHMQKTDDSI